MGERKEATGPRAPWPRAHCRLGREGERGRVRGGRAEEEEEEEEEEDGRRCRGPVAVGGRRWLQRHNRAEGSGAAGQDAQEAVGSGVVGPRSSTTAPTAMASGRLLPAQIRREDRRIRPWRHRIRQIRLFGPPPARQTESTRLHRRPSPAPAWEGEGEEGRERTLTCAAAGQ